MGSFTFARFLAASSTGAPLKAASFMVAGFTAATTALLLLGTSGNAHAAGGQEFAMLAGEIQVTGVIRSLDRAHDSIRIDVAEVTLPGGHDTILNPARPKVVVVDDGTAIYVRGDQQEEVRFGSLHPGTQAIVTGRDLGVGKPLPARSIGVWDSRAGGVYHFNGNAGILPAGGNNTAPPSTAPGVPLPSTPLRALAPAAGTVWSVTFSPDGHLFATGGDVPKVMAAAPDGTLTAGTAPATGTAPAGTGVQLSGGALWDPDTGALIHPVADGYNVFAVAFSPDNSLLATACGNGVVRLFSTQTGKLVRELGNPGRPVYTVSFSSAGGALASSTGDGTVQIWDTRTGDLLKTLNSNSGKIGTVAWGPGTVVVASGSGDSSLTIWDADTGVVKQTLQLGASPAPKIAFSPDGAHLAAGSRDGSITLWDLNAGKALWTQKLYSGRVTAIAFSSSGKAIAAGGANRMIRIVDARDGTPLKGFAAHNGPVDSVAFSRDGSLLASAGMDRLVKFWKMD